MTNKGWYSPVELRFKVREVLWLIQNLEILREGHWPPEATNYIDIFAIGGRHKAPFEAASEYYAEVTSRLQRCGVDGLILEALESWGKSVESMSEYLGMPEWSLMKRRKLALGYVASGPVRRWHKTRKRAPEDYKHYKARKAKPPS